MKSDRRDFIKSAALFSSAAIAFKSSINTIDEKKIDYSALDKVLSLPVLKRSLFAEPVFIDKLELLRFENNFICRVRSRDGAEGISVSK